MASKTIITLVDLDDQTRYFTLDSLLGQLAFADLPGTAPIKGAMRNLTNAVKAMREAQNRYFKAAYGSAEKQAALSASKAAEAKVDKMLQSVNQIDDFSRWQRFGRSCLLMLAAFAILIFSLCN